MFLRLLWESFVRQRRRKLLAGIAILLGTTAVTAMLALATTIGDRIHKELAVYGANIIVYPKAEQLAVKVGGVDIKPSTGNAYLKESDLEKLKTIFWANNITGVSPELSFSGKLEGSVDKSFIPASVVGYSFDFINSARSSQEQHRRFTLGGSSAASGLKAENASEGVSRSRTRGLVIGVCSQLAPNYLICKDDGQYASFVQDHTARGIRVTDQ